MLFNSLHFLIFLPLIVALYYLVPHRFRWMLIFVGSCYFYMVFVPKYILILFFIILVDYIAALTIEKVEGRLKLFYLLASLLTNIGLLAFFKYFSFINENAIAFFSLFGKEIHMHHFDVILPIGLSFHTFQSMSYTIEVYKGRQKVERHLGYFANYVLFFPQMVAGPIERYSGLGNELRKEVKPSYENFAHGFRLVLFGLFIKMAVADNIAPYVNQVYNDPMFYGSSQILYAVLLFSIQIYADFFGYSTIALGSARLLGIKIMDNFKTPYLSKSVTEFWSRWHISLSTWFRDYLYIPLGGNRVKIPRWCINILIVFTVSGFWHGASWTFVVWGLIHGVMILLERFFSSVLGFKIKEGWSVMNILLTIKTYLVVSFIWIFFRAESFDKAILIIKGLFSNFHLYGEITKSLLPGIAAIAMIVLEVILYEKRFDERVEKFRTPYRWLAYTLLLFCIMALSGIQKFTFIYFQF